MGLMENSVWASRIGFIGTLPAVLLLEGDSTEVHSMRSEEPESRRFGLRVAGLQREDRERRCRF
jgi:hypothetical protein